MNHFATRIGWKGSAFFEFRKELVCDLKGKCDVGAKADPESGGKTYAGIRHSNNGQIKSLVSLVIFVRTSSLLKFNL